MDRIITNKCSSDALVVYAFGKIKELEDALEAAYKVEDENNKLIQGLMHRNKVLQTKLDSIQSNAKPSKLKVKLSVVRRDSNDYGLDAEIG